MCCVCILLNFTIYMIQSIFPSEGLHLAEIK